MAVFLRFGSATAVDRTHCGGDCPACSDLRFPYCATLFSMYLTCCVLDAQAERMLTSPRSRQLCSQRGALISPDIMRTGWRRWARNGDM